MEIHLDSLKGLGAAYRIGGYVILGNKSLRFNGIVFGGHYGGHNVNIKFTRAVKTELAKMAYNRKMVIDLETEIQRRILQGDMRVHHEKLKPDAPVDALWIG
jgi:hypothetical protein